MNMSKNILACGRYAWIFLQSNFCFQIQTLEFQIIPHYWIKNSKHSKFHMGLCFWSVSQVFRQYWEIFIAVILWIFALLLTIFVESKWQIFNALTGTQQGGNLYQCILYIHFVHKWYGRVSTGRNHLKIKNVNEQLYISFQQRYA